MTTATILLLLVAAASTIAFSPPIHAGRLRRDIASGSQQGAYSTSGAGNFDQGESKSEPSLTEVCKGVVDVRDGGQDKGYNSVGYPGAVNFPSYVPPVPYYGPAFQAPFDFNALMQEHFYQLMRLAQQSGYNPTGTNSRGRDYYSYTTSQQLHPPFAPRYVSYASSYSSAAPNYFVPLPPSGYQQHQYYTAPVTLAQPVPLARLQPLVFSHSRSRVSFDAGRGFQAAQGQFPAGAGIPGDGPVSAAAVAQLDTRGGFGAASISPPPPGDLGLRFGAVGPASGNSYGVFTSSSSGTSDVNGQRKSYKQSTAVINDNGKVTTFHAQDP